MLSMDEWAEAMLKDINKNKEKGGEELAISDNDVDKIANAVIKKLSDGGDISTSKPEKKKPKQDVKEEPKEDEEDETEIIIEEE